MAFRGDWSGVPQCSLKAQIFLSIASSHHRNVIKPRLSAHRMSASQSQGLSCSYPGELINRRPQLTSLYVLLVQTRSYAHSIAKHR